MDWTEEQDDVLDHKGKLRKALNLAKLYGFLVAENVLSLQVLKVRIHSFRTGANPRSWASLICNR